MTEEQKQSISVAKKGKPGYWTGKKRSKETCQKIGNSHIGMHASEESRKKMSEAHMGGKNINSRAVIMYDLNGSELARFDSIARASRIMDIPQYKISLCVRNIKDTAGCYVFKYNE